MSGSNISRSSRLRVFAIAFVVASTACMVTPGAVLRPLEPILWLFGPPASLIYGTRYLWAFALGMGVTSMPLLLAVYGRPDWTRWLGCILAIVSWCLFGLLVYAPGA